MQFADGYTTVGVVVERRLRHHVPTQPTTVAAVFASESHMRIGTFASLTAVLSLIVIGQSAGQLRSTGQGPNDKIIRIRRPDGQPCLQFTSESQADAILKDSYHHYVFVENGCSQRIAVQICYRRDSESCQTTQLAPYDSSAVMLGTMVGQPEFEFDFTEH
jgi:hypothetical protein